MTFALLRMSDTSNDPALSESVATPDISASVLVSGLEHPWDIDFLPDETMIFSERSGELSKLVDNKKTVIESPDDISGGGEGGLLGIAIDPEFNDSRYIFACFNSTEGDVRVARWVANQDVSQLTQRTDIVTGIPSSLSGRHSGCQLAFGPDGNLWIGTGDAADETQPQDLTKLGGKILRINRDGDAAADNVDGPDRRVYSFGHRNTQGLAFYSSMRGKSFGISVEHGSGADDEVNQLQPGNFGWAPGANYDENVPMTDLERFSDAVPATWSSGDTTIAPSGAAFLSGKQWGRLEGWLAVSVLKDQKVLLLNIVDGKIGGTRTLLENEYGRLRAATIGPDGSLYVSTDNGVDDSIIRIAPAR